MINFSKVKKTIISNRKDMVNTILGNESKIGKIIMRFTGTTKGVKAVVSLAKKLPKGFNDDIIFTETNAVFAALDARHCIDKSLRKISGKMALVRGDVNHVTVNPIARNVPSNFKGKVFSNKTLDGENVPQKIAQGYKFTKNSAFVPDIKTAYTTGWLHTRAVKTSEEKDLMCKDLEKLKEILRTEEVPTTDKMGQIYKEKAAKVIKEFLDNDLPFNK